MDFDLLRKLTFKNDSKIVLLVMDGLGGLPLDEGKLTELEAAATPNLDNLASHGICGLHQPVGPGITPGSGPAHLALFGYDPISYQVGRGVLSALGTGFDLQKSDVAARGNFCTIDSDGKVTDRRAGRIETEKNRQLCKILNEIKIPGVEVFVNTVKEYRFLLVLRGDHLNGQIADTDPQHTGKLPLEPRATAKEAEQTASLVNQFVDQAKEKLADHSPANMVLLRGFSQLPSWPLMPEVMQVRAAAIAAYPMYRGVAKLVGMDLIETENGPEAQFATLKENWDKYDFFYVHIKRIDSAGEDGDFDRKVKLIEEVDQYLDKLTGLNPDVIVVTGDHSTPAAMKSHSWHPVPVLIWSKLCRKDRVDRFAEQACVNGALGPNIPAQDLLSIAFANAGRIDKFGA